MPDHATIGGPSGPADRDGISAAPNVFGSPSPSNPELPGRSHHLAPTIESAPVATSSVQEDWKTILEETPVALFILDSAQQLLFENSRCRELTGLSIESVGGVEEWFAALCPHAPHRDEVLTSWQNHLWANQTTRIYSLRCSDQKIREVEFRATLRSDGGISVALEDVTDRLREEEKHLHGRRKFRALFEQTDNGSVLLDRMGRIVDTNSAFLGLVDLPLADVRMTRLADLFHPRDGDVIERLRLSGESEGEAVLRCREGEVQTRFRYQALGEPASDPPMGIVLFDPEARRESDRLRDRLTIVRRKAQALLTAVPDLILLIGADLKISDFAPPPEPWPGFEPEDSWRGSSVDEAWPVLGKLLNRSHAEIVDRSATVRAEIEGEAPCEITATGAGNGEILVVVRRKFPAPSGGTNPDVELNSPSAPEVAPTSIPDEVQGHSPLELEKKRHDFRNQLQLVTSLFSLEPQGAAARDAFLRWQIRLRSLALALPIEKDDAIDLVDMIRSMADEVCSITGQGPGRRNVVVAGTPNLKSNAPDASLLALFSGELMRLVLGTPQHGRGPAITFDLEQNVSQGLEVRIRSGEGRRFLSADEDSEIEILELLAVQMRGELRFLPSPDRKAAGEWILSAKILKA